MACLHACSAVTPSAAVAVTSGTSAAAAKRPAGGVRDPLAGRVPEQRLRASRPGREEANGSLSATAAARVAANGGELLSALPRPARKPAGCARTVLPARNRPQSRSEARAERHTTTIRELLSAGPATPRASEAPDRIGLKPGRARRRPAASMTPSTRDGATGCRRPPPLTHTGGPRGRRHGTAQLRKSRSQHPMGHPARRRSPLRIGEDPAPPPPAPLHERDIRGLGRRHDSRRHHSHPRARRGVAFAASGGTCREIRAEYARTYTHVAFATPNERCRENCSKYARPTRGYAADAAQK